MSVYDVQDFEAEVLERSRRQPVLVDFWAAWCGPCRALGPVLERLAAGAGDAWALAKLDTEAHPDIAERYRITSIPNVKLFWNGEVVSEFTGVYPESEIRRWLGDVLPGPHRERVREAGALLEARRWSEACAILEEVLAADPEQRVARVMLAEAQLRTDPTAVPSTVKPLEDDAELAAQAEALLALASVAVHAGGATELPAGPAADALARAGLAIQAGDWEPAVAALIESMRADAKLAGGAARRACRAIFQLLGTGHPAVEEHFRAFSSLVNA